MPSFLLHIPAYHSTIHGDVDKREVVVSLDDLPRENEQIAVPNGGIVEVATVRHWPVWEDDGERQKSLNLPFSQTPAKDAEGQIEYQTLLPSVFTCWAVRPDDAPKTRSAHKLSPR